jgi:hypothetical protein
MYGFGTLFDLLFDANWFHISYFFAIWTCVVLVVLLVNVAPSSLNHSLFTCVVRYFLHIINRVFFPKIHVTRSSEPCGM